MSRNLSHIFALDIRNAELQGGIRDLIVNWSKQPGDDASVQAQWQIITDRLKNDKLLAAFRLETGIAQNTTGRWSSGEDLPSTKMCVMYMELIVEKMNEEIQDIAAQRRRQLEPLRRRGGDMNETEELSLPESVILSFTLPETLDDETPITSLDGYSALTTRVSKYLQNGGFVYAKDLASQPESDTWQVSHLRTPNIGRKSVAELYHFMINNGFTPELAQE